jgi:hypothetical protein
VELGTRLTELSPYLSGLKIVYSIDSLLLPLGGGEDKQSSAGSTTLHNVTTEEAIKLSRKKIGVLTQYDPLKFRQLP